MTAAPTREMVEVAPATTRLVEFRDPSGRLMGVSLTDFMRSGLSGVYKFFEPDAAERSLGTFIILWHVERARELGLPYVYLGYWIRESRKMAYKARFAPLERLDGAFWRPLRRRHGRAGLTGGALGMADQFRAVRLEQGDGVTRASIGDDRGRGSATGRGGGRRRVLDPELQGCARDHWRRQDRARVSVRPGSISPAPCAFRRLPVPARPGGVPHRLGRGRAALGRTRRTARVKATGCSRGPKA